MCNACRQTLGATSPTLVFVASMYSIPEDPMKTLAFTTVLCGLLLSTAEAQTIYLGAGGTYSIMKAPDNYMFLYKARLAPWWTTFEEISGTRADRGFSLATALEFRLSELPFTATAGLSYTQLYGKADNVKAPSPPWYGTMYTIGELTTRSNIVTLDVGLRWHVVRSTTVEPYVSLGLLYNLFGDTRLTIRNAQTTVEGTIDGNSRMGLSLGAGVVVPVLATLDLRLGGNYALMNLISPESQEEAKNMANFGVSFLYRVH